MPQELLAHATSAYARWAAVMTREYARLQQAAERDDDTGPIDLYVAHPRPSDLRITLTNPSDNEVLVFDGATSGTNEIYLSGQALMGFSGDESVNGVWRLRVVDSVSGQAGTIEDFGLEIGSRWD